MLKIKSFRLGKMHLSLLMLFQKPKKLISLSVDQKSKKKSYIYIMKTIIKKNEDSIKFNAILKMRLSISHVFIRVHSRKKKTSRKKKMIYILIKANKTAFI